MTKSHLNRNPFILRHLLTNLMYLLRPFNLLNLTHFTNLLRLLLMFNAATK